MTAPISNVTMDTAKTAIEGNSGAPRDDEVEAFEGDGDELVMGEVEVVAVGIKVGEGVDVD